MRLRKKRIQLRLSDDEYLQLGKQAEQTGMTRSQLLRSYIMGKEIHAKPSGEYLRLVREINAIGNNINQIAHIANSQRYIDKAQIRYITGYLDNIMEKVRDLR